MMQKIITSTGHALRGFRHAYQSDRSFRYEVWGALDFAIIAAILWPLSALEIILLALAYGLILITELINTSLEQMLERVHPEEHEPIGKSKDIAASAVLMSFVVAGIIVTFLLLARFDIIALV